MQFDFEFEKPNSKGYMIYTKTNCPYCTKIKDLLLHNVNVEITFINCDKYLIEPEVKKSFLKFIQSINGGISHRTFPMVFYERNFIGGYTDAEKFYTKQNIFSIDTDF
jgi:glutaredoxin